MNTINKMIKYLSLFMAFLTAPQAFIYAADVQEVLSIRESEYHPPVQTGTRATFEKLGYTVLYEVILPADYNGDVSKWWNGLYVGVIRK